MKFCDQKITHGKDIELILCSVSLISIVFIVYGSVAKLIFQHTDAVWVGLVSIGIALIWFFYLVLSITESIRTIKNLYFLKDRIKISPYIGFRRAYEYSWLYKLSRVKQTAFNRHVAVFASKEPSYDLILNNGKRYRISPFMERQEELISKLQSIIADNQKSKN